MISSAPLETFHDVAVVSRSGVLAHQGGWDEILLVVVPLTVVAGLLWLANRRVSAQLEAAEANGGVSAPSAPGGSTPAEPADDAGGSTGTDSRS